MLDTMLRYIAKLETLHIPMLLMSEPLRLLKWLFLLVTTDKILNYLSTTTLQQLYGGGNVTAKWVKIGPQPK